MAPEGEGRVCWMGVERAEGDVERSGGIIRIVSAASGEERTEKWTLSGRERLHELSTNLVLMSYILYIVWINVKVLSYVRRY